jgi:23S rRNA pseudouridine1911/1915/1917 synthase
VSTSLPLRVTITPEQATKRLDGVLRPHLPGYSRAAVHELFQRGCVRVDGRVVAKGELARAGQVLEVVRVEGTQAERGTDTQSPDTQSPDSQSLAVPPLRVLYEDEALVVVDKPAHLPSHALRPLETRTLAAQLLARYPEMAEVGHSAGNTSGNAGLEPGILHRLDTETSGVLLAARTQAAFERLKHAHAQGRIDKRYVALCAGHVRAAGPVHAYLAADRRKVRVQSEPFASAKAVSLTVLDVKLIADFSFVTVAAAFAARHQVRAQLASLGHPIAGDALYGGPALPGLRRHFLHASELRFARVSAHESGVQKSHGGSGRAPAEPAEVAEGADALAETIHVVAELPPELVAVLDKLRA